MRRFIRGAAALAVAAVVLAGIGAAGVASSMADSFPAPPPGTWPPAPPVPPDRLLVAVAVGSSGTVAGDALAPYGVFAESPRFGVRVVAEALSPVTLSGGLHVVPDATFAQVDAGRVPDVVVVPAVVEWSGPAEAPLRDWVARQARRGSLVLGVCSGAKVLAEAGVLDGRRATTFWSAVEGMRDDYPGTDWHAGVRYVEDGDVITTAGVSSGVVGALRVVERLAGPAEADRVGARAGYPGWTRNAPLDIPVRGYGLADLPYALNAAFPLGRGVTGIGVSSGVDELALAAALEVYSGSSFAEHTIPVAAAPETTTRGGLRLLPHPPADLDRLVLTGDDPVLSHWAQEHGVPIHRSTGFDSALVDLAASADRASAAAAAEFTEYPADHLHLDGPAWPMRSTALFAASLALAALLGVVVLRWRRTSSGGPLGEQAVKTRTRSEVRAN